MTTPRKQLIEAIAPVIQGTRDLDLRMSREEWRHEWPRLRAESVLRALSDLGAVVLLPVKVDEIPEGSTVHLGPPTVSLNWPDGDYRPFVNGDSKVFVDALAGKR